MKFKVQQIVAFAALLLMASVSGDSYLRQKMMLDNGNDETLMTSEALVAKFLATNDYAELEANLERMADAIDRVDTLMNRAVDIIPTVFNVFMKLIERELQAANETHAEKCFTSTIDVFRRSRQGGRTKNWAKKWTDSRGRKPSGVLLGAFNFIGAPDECVKARPPTYDPILEKLIDFDPKFCRLIIRLKLSPDSSFPLPLGVCLPDYCTGEDVNAIFRATIDALILRGRSSSNKNEDELLRLFSDEDRFWLEHLLDELDDENTRDRRLAGSTNSRGIVDILASLANFLESTISLGESLSCINGQLQPTDEIANYGNLTVIIIVALNAISTLFEFFYIMFVVKKKRDQEDEHVQENNDKQHQEIEMNTMENGRPEDVSHHHHHHHHHHHEEKKKRLHPAVIDYRKQPLWLNIATSWSVIRNFVELFDFKVKFEPLAHLAGIRFITLMWVVLGHGYWYGAWIFNLDNILTWVDDQKSFTNQIVKQSAFGADTMFLLTGFLVAFVSIKKLRQKRTNPWTFWAFFYIRRYIRLTPMIALAAWTYYSLTPWSYIGITFPKDHDPRCEENWWSTILYINNFYEPLNKCLGWTWAFSVDFQFYIIAPIFIMSYLWQPVLGVALAAAAIAVHISTNIGYGVNLGASSLFIVQAQEFIHTKTPLLHVYEEIYIKPWTRVGPFGVGLMLAFIVTSTRFRMKINRLVAILLWIVSVTTAFALIWGLFPYQQDWRSMPRELDLVYLGLSRVAWSLCIAWPIFACSHGSGFLINKVLSMRSFQVLSKLSFVAFVIHPIIQEYWILARERLFHFMLVDMIWIYCGHLCLTMAISVVFYVGFERPFINMLDTCLLGSLSRSFERKNK